MWPFSKTEQCVAPDEEVDCASGKEVKCTSESGVHDFTQWERIGTPDIVRQQPDGRKAIIGYSIIQKRVCTICGFGEINLQKIMLHD